MRRATESVSFHTQVVLVMSPVISTEIHSLNVRRSLKSRKIHK